MTTNKILGHIPDQVYFRYKLYKRLFKIQLVLIISGFLVGEFLKIYEISALKPFVISLFFLAGAGYFYILSELLSSFVSNRFFRLGLLIFLLSQFLLIVLVENPIFIVFGSESRRVLLFIVHLGILMVESGVIYFSVNDLFRSYRLSPGKLISCAALYLMIALAFASLYDLIILFNPYGYGSFIKGGFSSYSESIYYSVNHLIKVSNAFPNASILIKRIGILEAVAGELFVALLIGNLLSKPQNDNL